MVSANITYNITPDLPPFVAFLQNQVQSLSFSVLSEEQQRIHVHDVQLNHTVALQLSPDLPPLAKLTLPLYHSTALPL